MLGQQRAIGGQAADARTGRQRKGGAQFRLTAPSGEMLGSTLCQVLPLGDRLGLMVALDHGHADAALAQLDGQTHADRATARDDDVKIAHAPITPCSM